MKRIPFQTAAAIAVITVAASAAEKNTDPTLADYRWHNDKVKFEKLSDKGLKYEQIAPKKPIQFGRPRPAIPFAKSRVPGKSGSITQRKVTVNLVEEAGVARSATPIKFGLPLPKSGLYDLASMRVLSPDGREVPAQFTATAFWPDDSLKWVLVDFQAKLGANQSANYAVELGSKIVHGKQDSPLSLNETDEAITVSTGAIEVVVDKQRFNILRSVKANGQQIAASAVEGVRLVDEHGQLFTLSGAKPKNVTIEEQGPEKVVVAVAGDYADAEGKTYMSYVTRLTFRNGSPRVTVAHTHVNTYVKTEFTDITSLSMPMRLSGPLAKSVAYWPQKGGKWREMGVDLAARGRFSLLQAHEDRICTVSGSGDATTGPSTSGRYPGVLRIEGADDALNMVCHEFWQRWPKGFEVSRSDFRIELLPKQWGKQYGLDFPRYGMGSELPHWLLYPFVEGKYRFKWGMSFTTRVTFDFGGQTPLEELRSDANAPVVAVLPASWYAQTKAMGEMAAPGDKQMAQWDKYVAKAYEQDMTRKAHYREYGFFNYGDWYGERGRNWGNNEYDLAHGFFTQFVRTGRRDYFRLALAAARHQADVDCVHAYPDPFYVGANHPHSIGHTGITSHEPVHATWSCRSEAPGGIDYDFAGTGAVNGHTWVDGMMDAWYLTGEAQVMNACIAIGEQIAWAMSKNFNELSSHERSAGWALRAIMAIYRGTYDPVYLEAAKRIAVVPLREQKFDKGGAWPHILPAGHASSHRRAVGNNIFIVGVLLAGLKSYHAETGDLRVERSLISGARWVMKSWDPDDKGWPQSAGINGEPFQQGASIWVTPLIIEPLAYVARLTNDAKMMQCVETAFMAVVHSDARTWGKASAMNMHFSASIMGQLQQWRAEQPRKP